MDENESNARQVSNREVKSSLFTTVFSDPENAAQLYSALDGVPAKPEDIQYTTLEGVLFVARKNDMAFTVQNRVLVISEHQSTVNNNMPLRDVIYYGRTMERLIKAEAIYQRKLIPIPTPEFFVFYNGDEPFPSEKTLKLSDAYLEKTNTPMLELIVKVININLPAGHAILKQCRPLYEYSWFIQRIKDYQQEAHDRDTAFKLAIQDCINAGIFADFVQKHGSEAVNMLFTQFNMDDALAVRYREGVEDGEERGMELGMERGEELKIIELIRRKIQKGKSAEIAAEELEEPLEHVTRIYTAFKQCGTETDALKIYEYLQQN